MSKWSSLRLCRLLSVTALAVEETYWRAMLQRVRTVRFDRRGTAYSKLVVGRPVSGPPEQR